MSQAPFLKSIRPVNLLSFGPSTPEIELRPLNILIGPNGCGKSNLIETIRLLHYLPDKDPWSVVLQTGGVDQWIWNGRRGGAAKSSITARISLAASPDRVLDGHARIFEYSIHLAKVQSSFYVTQESARRAKIETQDENFYSSFESSGSLGELKLRNALHHSANGAIPIALNAEKSVLSQLTSRGIQEAHVGTYLHELFEIGEFLESLDFHQDWEFGADLTPRDPVPVGQPVEKLEENAYNLAQLLAHFRSSHRQVYDRIEDLMRQFYEPLKSVEVQVLGTSLQIAMIEEGGHTVTAHRLSDGTLRWLALLTILLNPAPPPLTCIDEPELGLHPDILPTLADLLVEASSRTQLIVTTHSRALIDAFTDMPEAVCVCEKEEGSTVIRRLDKDDLQVWLNDYSLGNLWTGGQIGGNRW